MNIIKLNAIDSTNDYLKNLLVKKTLDNYTIVTAEFQYKGKGQVGGVWESQASKNLMCSIYLSNPTIKLNNQFDINMIVCLAIKRSLNKFNIPQISVKWPNDIMSGSFKLCGILIENIVKNNSIQDIIIGVGMNVNQTEFNNLPNATSIKKISGKYYDTDEILSQIVIDIKFYFSFLQQAGRTELQKIYEANLYRINKVSMFRLADANLVSGYIKGVNEYGRLKVIMENDLEETYGIKEISLVN